jgi:hypothetical protein
VRKLIDLGKYILVLDSYDLHRINRSLCPYELVPDKPTINQRLFRGINSFQGIILRLTWLSFKVKVAKKIIC